MTTVSDEDKARMVLLRALNYDGNEIAEKTGYSPSTVYRHLREVQALAEQRGEEYAFWVSIVPLAFGSDFQETAARLLSSR